MMWARVWLGLEILGFLVDGWEGFSWGCLGWFFFWIGLIGDGRKAGLVGWAGIG